MTPHAKKLRFELFVATWLSYAGFYVTRKVFSVVKGPIKAQLQIDDLGVSHLFTIYLVTYMLGQFATASLSRRYTHRKQLLWGMSISVACNIAMGLLLPMGPRAYVWLLVVMAIHGAAQGTGWACNVGLMANWTRHHERGRVMALWGTCYQLGAVFAKAFAAFLLGWVGLFWSFHGSSVLLAVVVVIFWFWARETPEEHGIELREDEVSSPGVVIEKKGRGTMGLVVAMGMTYFAFKFLRYALDSWSTLIISEHFEVTTTNAGYFSAVFDWVGFLGVIAAGYASDRLFAGRRMPVIAAMALGCLVFCGALWAVGMSSLPMFVVLLGVIGFMEMGPDSLLVGVGAMDVGSRRAAAMAAGVINGLGSIGPIVQEPVIGWLKRDFGVDAVLVLLVAVSALATVASVALRWGALRRGLAL